jgi:hypothetical protein
MGPTLRGRDEVAREEHGPEATAEPDGPGIGDHALDPRPERGDLGRPIVDPDDAMPQGGQRTGDPAGPTAEVQDGRAGSDHLVDELGLTRGGQAPVERDRAPVGGEIGRLGAVGRARHGVRLEYAVPSR